MARRKSQEEIIALAVGKHEGFYTYEKAVYVDSKTKFEVTCPSHESFWITPNNHLSGKGCTKCGDLRTSASKQKTTEEFVRAVHAKFPGKFTFGPTVYKSARDKVFVECTKHTSIFSVTPDNLLRGKSCPLCADESRLNTRAEMFEKLVPTQEQQFVEDSLKLHGGRYQYLGGYRTKESLVKLHCEDHGTFHQKALVHLGGSGCPSCAEFGFNPDKQGMLYVLVHDNLTKIGITNRTPEHRVRSIKRTSERHFDVTAEFPFEKGITARNIETTLLRELRSTHEQPAEKFDGSTECFYNVDHQWLLSRIDELIKEHTNGNNRSIDSNRETTL